MLQEETECAEKCAKKKKVQRHEHACSALGEYSGRRGGKVSLFLKHLNFIMWVT